MQVLLDTTINTLAPTLASVMILASGGLEGKSAWYEPGSKRAVGRRLISEEMEQSPIEEYTDGTFPEEQIGSSLVSRPMKKKIPGAFGENG